MPLNTSFAPPESSRFDVHPKLCVKCNKAFRLSCQLCIHLRLPGFLKFFSVNGPNQKLNVIGLKSGQHRKFKHTRVMTIHV